MSTPATIVDTPGARADAAVATVLSDLDRLAGGTTRGVVVDSPPGAGKSTLVVRAALHLVARGEYVMVIAQTNEQVDDLTERLARNRPDLVVGRLLSTTRPLSPRLAALPGVVSAKTIPDLGPTPPPIIIATAAKWPWVKEEHGHWSRAIVDEAYQMRSDALLACAPLFDSALFVGDPGQLDPFSTVETDRWTGLTWDPLRNAVDVTLAHNPAMAVRALPVSWRLPATAAPLVERAFYPFTPFDSGTGPDDRRMTLLRALAPDPIDQVLDRAAETGWGHLELPFRQTLRTDRELARALADTASRLVARGTTTFCDQAPPPEGRRLTPARIAIGVAHNDQAEAVRSALAPELDGITVDTANRLQGREFDVTLVWHPLSGRADASAFHLETGRLCVLLSRHRHACLVVARAGIPELLDRHPSHQPVHLDVPPKFPDGWRAHQIVMDHLQRPEHRVQILD
ncbi:AAA family ATPase [Streptomyces millisiae]|uniref:AAA family ATPase n=1 Tax=Streptomyces millisiae TaxID=3075542 RepID=A0ABU2LN22_9ACTN|nr:AAA family ATPase [Streptomyces sp. DSM 44918]MDT0318448.1 AAA family ATPase [Streptomyces sp. DSM 44918]